MSGRCLSCDCKLTNAEMCRKHAITGEYFQLCNSCLQEVIAIVSLPINGDTSFVHMEEKDDTEQTMS